MNSLLEIINEKGEENYRRYVAESLDILLNYKNNSSVINLFKDKMLPSKLPKLNDNLPKLTTDFLKFINIICKNYNYFIIDEKKYEFKIPLVATIKSEDYIPKRISKINILLKYFFDKITKDPNFGIYYKEKIKEFCDKESCNGNKQCSVIKFINETINKGNSNNQNINKLLMVANNNKIYDQEILVKFINIKNLKNILKEKNIQNITNPFYYNEELIDLIKTLLFDVNINNNKIKRGEMDNILELKIYNSIKKILLKLLKIIEEKPNDQQILIYNYLIFKRVIIGEEITINLGSQVYNFIKSTFDYGKI